MHAQNVCEIMLLGLTESRMQSAKRAKNEWSCRGRRSALVWYLRWNLCRGAAEFRRQNVCVQVSGMDRTDLLITIVDIIRQ